MAKSNTSATDEILKILKSIQEKQTKMEHRLDALEEHMENVLLPTRRRISPALQDTLIAVQKLAGPDRWVSIPQISEETKRSIQTEEGYARKLDQLGIIRRQAFITSRKDKKRREYQYRPKE
jgi:hypothetical protein